MVPMSRPATRIARIASLLLILALPVVPMTVGASLADGLGAYAGGNYVDAYRKLRPLAERGGAIAQVLLGAMYLDGKGVDRDVKVALEWYRKAAAQGHTGAQFKLGQLYTEGRVVVPDVRRAEGWFRRAAEGGHPDAQYLLATLVERSASSDEQLESAIQWYEQAADKGHRLARRRLIQGYEGPPPQSGGEGAPAGARPPNRADPAVPSVPAVPNVPNVGGYSVQLGSFRGSEKARRHGSNLEARHPAILSGVGVFVVRVDLGADMGVWHRLRAGPIPSASAARALCETLRRAGTSKDCYAVAPADN